MKSRRHGFRPIRGWVVGCFALLLSMAAAQAVPILVISDAAIVEGNSGTSILTLAVNFSGAQPGTVSGVVSATPLSGSFFRPATGAAACGAAGVDFEQFTNVPFTIPPNTPNGVLSVNIRICADTLFEPDEHIFVAMTGIVGATCLEGTCSAVATIINDEAPPVVSINSISTSEPSFITRTATFTASLNRPSGLPVTMNFATRNGTAKATCQLCSPPVTLGDYEARSAQLSIPAGATSATIAITINSDSIRERAEDFFVELTAPLNATLGTGTGRAVISDTQLLTGSFDLSPGEVEARLGEKVLYTLDWTVPPHQVWRNLSRIDLRLRGAHDTALWLRWDEASNEISLCRRASNAGGLDDHEGPAQQTAVCGDAALPGSGAILATPFALVHLADTVVKGSGPSGDHVTLTLAITPVGRSAGHTYKVELSAGDDFGNADAFERAGSLIVRER